MRQRVIYSLVFYKIGQKKGWNVLLRISIVSENYENEMNNLIELSWNKVKLFYSSGRKCSQL
jgi:hypothetical protein